LENDLERVEENIATIEGRLDEEDGLEARREELDAMRSSGRRSSGSNNRLSRRSTNTWRQC
jgi:hypothetical protein